MWRTNLQRMAPFSYRSDPSVPPFPDDKALIVYDGVCVLCSVTMRTIAARDTAGHYRYVSGQSTLGQALYRHYQLDPTNFETVLLIDNGNAYGKFDMLRRVARRLGGAYRALLVFAILPTAVQDWCYDLIAKNRYRLFGRMDVCMVPDPSWRSRVIE